jgi:hypothetical protein
LEVDYKHLLFLLRREVQVLVLLLLLALVQQAL